MIMKSLIRDFAERSVVTNGRQNEHAARLDEMYLQYCAFGYRLADRFLASQLEAQLASYAHTQMLAGSKQFAND